MRGKRLERREKLAQKVVRREKLAPKVGRREIYSPVPPPPCVGPFPSLGLTLRGDKLNF